MNKIFSNPEEKGWKVVKLKDVAKADTTQIIPEKGKEYYYIGLEHIESRENSPR